MLGAILGQATGALGYTLVFGAPAFLVLAYFFITWEKKSPDSPSADDGQVGLKLGLFFLALVGLGMAVSGCSSFLHYLLSGAKIGSGSLKTGIASILTGLIVVGGIWFVFLPRTNYSQYPKATRLALGYITVLCGLSAAVSLNGFVDGLFNSAPWALNSGNFANLLVFGALAVLTLSRFGALSGWTAPPPRQAGFQGGFQGQPGAPGGFAPPGGAPQGGFAPQGGAPQGGFPPQGGAPQGGFPPQGGAPQGGFPPQGGAPQAGAPQAGAPAQPSGGFPAPGSPQGGGGLPPPSGSGGGGQGGFNR